MTWRPSAATLAAMVAMALYLAAPGSWAAESGAAGAIRGLLGLQNPAGRMVSGENVTLLLVRSAVAVPDSAAAPPAQNRFERAQALNRTHMAFFLAVRQALEQPGYRVADTVSAKDGTFGFAPVPAGRYYIVVTFPTLVGGTKAAWQVPVVVAGGKTVRVALDQRNLCIPLER